MTKRDMAVRIARKTGFTQRQVMDVIQHMLDTIIEELSAGRDVEFRNFGVFEPTVRKARVGRNPNQPSRTVKIPRRVVVKFKPGKVMKDKVGKIKPNQIEE